MLRRLAFVFAVALAAAPPSVWAQGGQAPAGQVPAGQAPPVLVLPANCTPGADCWVVNYVDHQLGKGVRDYACGEATYDFTPDHDGIDIAVRDEGAMRDGVTVVAAAAGRVKAVRDAMDDVNFRDIGGRSAVQGRECGNAVILQHGGGWETRYCHMRRGSVAVKAGQIVTQGQPLGMVGLSGMTEFPHIHMDVKLDGRTVDPFVGTEGGEACAMGRAPLWDKAVLAALRYPPTAIWTAGVSEHKPPLRAIHQGRAPGPPTRAGVPELFAWAEVVRPQPGDTVRVSILTAGGVPVVRKEYRFAKPLARGALPPVPFKPTGGAWPAGDYITRYELVFNDPARAPEIIERTFELR
jgi:murein DD-endopeptidase MepM/ murein hydrolase activator NlpD